MRGLVVALVVSGCAAGPGDATDAADARLADTRLADARVGVDAPPPPADAPPPLLAASGFELGAFDTGNLADQCTMLAPWGDAWGIDAETFTDPQSHTLGGARFAIYDVAPGNQAGYMYGVENQGRWGFVRFIQGDVWGGGNCGPIAWHRFTPLPTAGNDIHLRLSMYRDTARLTTATDSWILFAINVWFTSPDMPKAGGDALRRKPLVMDLAFHHACNMPGCRLRNYEDDAAYHYQALVGALPDRAWTALDVPLAPHVAAAIEAFGLQAAAPTLALYQVEILIELHNAEGAASVDDYLVTQAPAAR